MDNSSLGGNAQANAIFFFPYDRNSFSMFSIESIGRSRIFNFGRLQVDTLSMNDGAMTWHSKPRFSHESQLIADSSKRLNTIPSDGRRLIVDVLPVNSQNESSLL